jgi:deoxyribonuclease-4
MPTFEELLKHLAVTFGATGLEDRSLVPVELQPPQRVEDLLDVLGGRTLSVGIFDPEHEAAVCPAGEQPVVQSGPGASDVKSAGRGWSKPNAHEIALTMLIGAHVSQAGGLANAVQRGTDRGCNAIQIFNQSPRMWRPTAYDEEDFAAFREAMRASKVEAVLIHAVYLLNCASEDREIRSKSLASLTQSLRVGAGIGAVGVVLHPGSAKHGDVPKAINRAGRVIEEALAESTDCRLLLEDTAGAGGTLGRSFEELAALIEASGGDRRLGLCLDSCHLFASGYDVRTAQGLSETLDECNRVVGLDRLRSLHVNDSMTPLGSNRDRHAILGQGELGEKGCAAFLSEPRFQRLPSVLETGRDGGAPAAEDVALAFKLYKRGTANRSSSTRATRTGRSKTGGATSRSSG